MESIALLDPYAILGLPRGCDESDVRRRYLDLVRQFPPDRARNVSPRFAGPIEKLRDPVVRLRSKLFDLESSGTIVDLMNDVRRRVRIDRLPTSILLSLAE